MADAHWIPWLCPTSKETFTWDDRLGWLRLSGDGMGAQERSKVRKRMTSPHSFYPETLKKSMSLCCGDSWSCLASLYSSLVLKPSFWIIWVTLYPSNKLPCCSDSTKLGSVLATCLSSGCWNKHYRLGGFKQQKCSLTVLGAGSSRSRHRHGFVLTRAPFPAHSTCSLSLCPRVIEGERELSRLSFIRALILFARGFDLSLS